MQQLQGYIRDFYRSLTVGIDKHDGQCYNIFMREAALRFLAHGSDEAAYEVYRIFFECYNLEIEGGGASFLRLLEKLRQYETNAATLIDKQRDHFVHSVNVFLLGLAVYSHNKPIRDAFYAAVKAEKAHEERFDTIEEEFYFRWGIAALCHDIGYPIEIITNQVNEFIHFTSSIDPDETRIVSHIEYDNFGVLNAIPEKTAKRIFIERFYDKYDECVYVDLLKSIDLLAFRVSRTLGLDIRSVKDTLDNYLSDSARSGRIDHGFFSALMLLKWYGYLIQTSGIDPDKFYYPVLDSAAAILLHNFYAVKLQKPPFSMGPFPMEKYPLAFLLILCDELQEWNRRPYGAADKLKRRALDAAVGVDDRQLSVHYTVERGMSAEGYAGAKYLLFCKLLDASKAFPDGFRITCEHGETPKDLIAMRSVQPGGDAPLPLTRNLRQIAEAELHAFNAMALSLDPGTRIDGETIEELDDVRKYYFLSEALELPNLLAAVDCELRTLDAGRTRVTAFTPDEIEILAARTHARWVQLHIEDGWTYARKTNRENKRHRCLVDYSLLDEDTKELDRAPTRALPETLASVGVGIYRRRRYAQMQFSQQQTESIARRAHAQYMENWREDHPGETPPLPDDFDALDEGYKQANRRQARSIPDKLSSLNYLLLPKGTDGFGEPVTNFTEKQVERLARIEHDEWVGDRLLQGWTYGPVRDKVKKHNENMIPYEQLAERMKEYDREPVRSIPALVDTLGLAIYRVD